MKEKYLIYGSKVLSIIFAPFYFSILACLILFTFSYLQMIPLNVKLILLGIVYFFTVALPLMGISAYRQLSGLHKHQITKREMRSVPYIITIVCYSCCLMLLSNIHAAYILISVIAGALVVEVVCSILNNWFRISTHAAAAGALNGALLAFSFRFNFNPIFWLCLTLLISGMVGSSRIILRQHTLREVNWGTAVGFLCGFIVIKFF